MVDHALALQPFADAGVHHEVHGALLQYAGADRRLDGLPRAALDDDGLHAPQVEQVR